MRRMKSRWANIKWKIIDALGTITVGDAQLTHYFKDTHHAGIRVMKSLCGIIALAKDLDSELTFYNKKCGRCQSLLDEKEKGEGGEDK